MPAKIAYVLPVLKLSRKQRRLGNKMFALAKACVSWLHYGWRALTNAKFLRLAAASLAFAGTMAATAPAQAATPAAGSFRVNQTISGFQGDPAVATDADGDSVVVWLDSGYGPFNELMARRYTRDGLPNGPEFQVVNGFVADVAPDVAMDAEGNFVVVWGGLNAQTWAQRFTADGSRNGRLFQVSQSQVSNDGDGPVVAMDAEGDFVVAWESYQVEHPSTSYSPGFGVGIAARVFDNKGDAVTDEFCVNSTVLDDQDSPAIAIDSDGDFVIVWEGFYNGNDNDVFGQRFNAAGERQGLEFRVNESVPFEQDEPDVAMDADGNFVAVWQSVYYSSSSSWLSANHNIVMRRYDAQGNALDGDQYVAQGDGQVSSFTWSPSIGMDADGNFAVAWEHEYSYSGSSVSMIKAQTFLADGNSNDSPVTVNELGNDQWSPSVAMDAEGDFIVVREGFGPGDTNVPGVFGRLYVEAGDSARPLVGGVYTWGADERLNDGERLANRPTRLVVTLSENMNTGDVENSSNWTLWHDGDDVTAWVSDVSFSWNANTNRYEALLEFAAALKDGSYTLTLDGSVRDAAGNSMGGDFSLDFSVWKPVALGSDRITDTNNFGPTVQSSGPSSGAIGNTSVAMDADGNYVVVWSETVSGSSYVGNTGYPAYQPIFSYYNNAEIFMRRYSADGTPLTAPKNITQTGSNSSRNEVNPKVAMDGDGNFVVVWAAYFDYYGSSAGYFSYDGQKIQFERFNSDGQKLDNNPVNVSIVGRAQEQPAVAMDNDGDFVIAWSRETNNGGGHDVFFKAFHADGSAFTFAPVRVSQTSWWDGSPAVDLDADGDFVIAWEVDRYVWSGYYTWTTDVLARRYDNAGFFRAAFDIAANPTVDEWSPAIALDHDGDFVVAWNQEHREYIYSYFSYSYTRDVVYAQAFNAFGEPRSDAQRVDNDDFNPSFDAMNPAIAMDTDGEFVISWRFSGPYELTYSNGYGSSSYTYNTYSGILARRFEAGANATEPQFLVNSTTGGFFPFGFGSGYSFVPAIAMDSDGDFVLSWSGPIDQRDYYVSYSGYGIESDNDFHYGIAHRRFGRNEAPIAADNLYWYAQEDDGTDWLDLDEVFHDSTDGVKGLSFSIVSNDNTGLVSATIDDNGTNDPDVKLQYTPDASGVAHITVRATDMDGKWTERTVTVTVDPVNDAPVLAAASPVLTDVLEDASNPAGNTVASIVGNTISDVDDDAVEGIAITAATTTNGTWQFSTNAGSSWTNFPAVAADAALLLRAEDMVRFVPAAGFTGSRTFTYQAWDQTGATAGQEGTTADATSNGGTTPFSTAGNTATVNVNNTNDAPTLSGAGALSDIDEDEADPVGDDVASIVGGTISDVDPGALEGIAVTGADSANGLWQYSMDGGSSWTDLPAVSSASALLLTPSDMLRFIPNDDFNGTADITYRAWDQTSGTAGATADTTTNGGSTAFSTATNTGTVTVNPVNDAPILTNTGNPIIGTISNTNNNPAGVDITTLVGSTITDIDAGALEGVAITNISGATSGVWQYSTDAGVTWTAFPSVSDTAALLLAADSRIRYVAGAGFVGTATVSYHAWDQTSGTAGGTADLTAGTGGTTAFSVDFETARVVVVDGGGDGGGDDSGCVANTGSQGAALGLLAVLMALMASLRGLVGRRSE